MKRLIAILKNRRTQYCIIVWILLLKVIEIVTSFLSEVPTLQFFAMLGFQSLSACSRLAWDALVVSTILWLCYRVWKDVFGFSVSLGPVSKLSLLSLLMLVIWTFSAVMTTLQFTMLVTAPLANPRFALSAYHTPEYRSKNPEIFGWYWIDWDPTYYEVDFQKVRAMFIDGVFLRSDKYAFLSHPEVFTEAIMAAKKYGLKVGILIFHPYDADFQNLWELPVKQGTFADFSANRSWIEGMYIAKLESLVKVGESLNVDCYVYDDMTFDRVCNLTNAQLFIDVTHEATHEKALMAAYYPCGNKTVLSLRIPHWDWYTLPDDVTNLEESLAMKPLNNTSIGQVVWLHKRTSIEYGNLLAVYDVLSDVDRIEIFALRYGDQSWADAISNSILEHPTLAEHLSSLNLQAKTTKDCSACVALRDWECNNITLDLLGSAFIDPFSILERGKTSECGTKYIGASYISAKERSLLQRTVEMRFCGNGTDEVGGWFAYRVELEKPIPVDENSTLLLLLKLSPSMDGSAWTWYRIDFSTGENETYSLIWSFHDVPVNYVLKNANDTTCRYYIGSAVDWRFYQFSLHNIFYLSFSKEPSHITGVRYAIGAECDNDVQAEFLLAKISPQPFEINGMRIEDENPGVDLENQGFEVRGLHFRKVLVASEAALAREDVNYQLQPLGMSKTEAYVWSLEGISNAMQFNAVLTFNVTSQASEFFLMDEEITSQVPEHGLHSIALNSDYEEIALVVVSASRSYFIPLAALMPLMIVLVNVLSRIMKTR